MTEERDSLGGALKKWAGLDDEKLEGDSKLPEAENGAAYTGHENNAQTSDHGEAGGAAEA
jgi:hypothetical protein